MLGKSRALQTPILRGREATSFGQREGSGRRHCEEHLIYIDNLFSPSCDVAISEGDEGRGERGEARACPEYRGATG
jgi:hypothetical protein